MKIKAVCKSCRRLYLTGKNGLCQSCLKPGFRYKKPVCYCGKPAAQVVFVTVLNPEGVERSVQLALCMECLELESQSESRPGRPVLDTQPNPIHVVQVKSIPRADSPLKGRKIA